jgi:hypothetical protein
LFKLRSPSRVRLSNDSGSDSSLLFCKYRPPPTVRPPNDSGSDATTSAATSATLALCVLMLTPSLAPFWGVKRTHCQNQSDAVCSAVTKREKESNRQWLLAVPRCRDPQALVLEMSVSPNSTTPPAPSYCTQSPRSPCGRPDPAHRQQLVSVSLHVDVVAACSEFKTPDTTPQISLS